VADPLEQMPGGNITTQDAPSIDDTVTIGIPLVDRLREKAHPDAEGAPDSKIG
jgi:hypothetical protein